MRPWRRGTYRTGSDIHVHELPLHEERLYHTVPHLESLKMQSESVGFYLSTGLLHVPSPASIVRFVKLVILKSLASCGFIFVKFSKISGYITGLVYAKIPIEKLLRAGANT